MQNFSISTEPLQPFKLKSTKMMEYLHEIIRFFIFPVIMVFGLFCNTATLRAFFHLDLAKGMKIISVFMLLADMAVFVFMIPLLQFWVMISGRYADDTRCSTKVKRTIDGAAKIRFLFDITEG